MNENNVKGSYQLPNGQWIQQINSYETDFVFNEIFINEVYLKHGIKIHDNALIFDIGANIGLFSLYIKQKVPSSKIYAFEPSPEVYSILKHNISIYGDSVHPYNLGLAEDEKKYPFYYYPGYSVISGFHVNKKRDTEIILSGMKINAKIDLKIESLVKERLEQLQTFQCEVTTLSRIIQQNEIPQIDLLKIDTEGSELAVLRGIEEKHWDKILQIVMEIHSKENLNAIMFLLNDKSFNIYIEADEQFKTSEIFNLYAYKEQL